LSKRYSNVKPVPGASGEWQTDEGLVKVTTQGDLLIATESFDAENAARLRDAMLNTAGERAEAAAAN